jgi:hypothetical protein
LWHVAELLREQNGPENLVQTNLQTDEHNLMIKNVNDDYKQQLLARHLQCWSRNVYKWIPP